MTKRKIFIQNRTKDTVFDIIIEKKDNDDAYVYIFDRIRGRDYYDKAEFDKDARRIDDLHWGDMVELYDET
jgi:hypothetical protein